MKTYLKNNKYFLQLIKNELSLRQSPLFATYTYIVIAENLAVPAQFQLCYRQFELT
jgi:hypothetical protein